MARPPSDPHRMRPPGARSAWLAPVALLVALLGGCASTPTPSTSSAPRSPMRDGPGAPPPDLAGVPDATPRIEPIRPGGPNKPYEVLGQAYAPLTGDPPLFERGLASWYGSKFHGRNTATGEPYDMYAMSAAHKTMPLPSYARVRNPANGREVVVRVNDRGPFHSDRVIDLSYTAALKLGLLGGVAPVELERITQESIRTGAWRGPATDTRLAALPPAVPELADPIAEIARRVAREPDPPAASPGPTRARADPLPARGDAAALPVAAAAAAPTPVAADATLAAVPGFWLQFGAFSQRDGALDLHQKLLRQAGWLAPLLAIFDDQRLHRVQAGPYASRADARSAAEQLRDALRQLPAIVERR